MKTNERQLISINIKEENGKQTVSARELHEKLGVEENVDYVDYVDCGLWTVDYVAIAQKKETAQGNISTYNFEENVDFTSVNSFTVVNNGAQKPIDKYYISIDMAKERRKQLK